MKPLLPTMRSDEIRALERQAFVETWSGPDHRDAIEAYFERRAPKWEPR